MGRRAIVLLVALILAGLAAWAIWNFLQGVQEDAEGDRVKQTVFVAGADGGIPEGTEGSILVSAFDSDPRCRDDQLALTDVTNCQIKKDLDEVEDVPVDAINSEEGLRQALSGRVAAGPISKGSILTLSQWVALDTTVVPLSEQIPSGKQALTISTSNVQGVNGFVEAGDRINMIITLDIEFDRIPVEGLPTLPGAGDETQTTEPGSETVVVTYTRYVMQGIPVLATGRDVRPDEDGDQTGEVPAATGTTVPGEAGAAEDPGNSTVFTLEVTPEQAERIVYAFENGSIWLTLVPEDFVEVETNGVIIDNLFGGDLIDEIFGQNN